MSQNFCEDEPSGKMFECTMVYKCNHMTFLSAFVYTRRFWNDSQSQEAISIGLYKVTHMFVVSNFAKPKPYVYWSKFRDWLVATICS